MIRIAKCWNCEKYYDIDKMEEIELVEISYKCHLCYKCYKELVDDGLKNSRDLPVIKKELPTPPWNPIITPWCPNVTGDHWAPNTTWYPNNATWIPATYTFSVYSDGFLIEGIEYY